MSRRFVLLFACVVGTTNPAEHLFAQARATQFGQSGIRAPDSAAVVRKARNLQARFERQRRRLLPRFYTGAPAQCVIVGRFCHSDSNRSEHVVVPDEGSKIRGARAQLLRDLEEAAAALPGDDWIVGQRIRYHVEARDGSALRIARTCAATRWWCDALTGYTLHAEGDFAGADSAFSLALDSMPSATRCHWINVAPLLDSHRREYRRLPCDQRETLVGRIWWLADPLLMTPGNERRTEHFSRVMHTTLLQKDALSTFGTSWGGDLAELIVRFGWPEKWTQQPPASSYSGAMPSVTGHEREPGFHFFLTRWPPPDSLQLVSDSLWDIDQHLPQELYAPSYARGFAPLDAQVARFRRADSTLVVAAYDVSGDTLFHRRKFTAALVATGDEVASPALHKVEEAPVSQVMTLTTPWKSQLIGVELLALDSAGAARWRSGFGEIPLQPDGISVSDLLFVDGTVPPGDLSEAIPRAHGGTVFRRNTKVGLFWEIYGTAAADTTLPISLTISPLEIGRLRAALGALRIAPKATPLNIRWQENGAAGMLSARSVMLDLSLVPPGKYEVKLEVGATKAARTSRVIRIR